MNLTPPASGDLWWTWTRRALGVLGFLTLLILFAAGREVQGVWLVLVGGLLGAEFLPWASKDR